MIKINISKTRNRFQESHKVNYVKVIKRVKSLQEAEVYLEPKRAFMMELFLNIAIKPPLQMFDWVIHRPPKILTFSKGSLGGANHRDCCNA